MAHEIRIVAGPQAGVSRPLSGAFFRIGADAECDLVIAGESPRSVIVRSRGGERLVYNRSDAAVSVGRKSVAPDASMPWRAGQPLRLASGVVLEWGDAAAATATARAPRTDGASPRLASCTRRPNAGSDNTAESTTGDAAEETPADGADSSGPSRAKTVASAMLVCGLMLLVFDDGPSLSPSATRLEAVLSELADDGSLTTGVARAMVQRGRRAEVRRDLADAREQYESARDYLHGEGSQAERDLVAWLDGRLKVLGPASD